MAIWGQIRGKAKQKGKPLAVMDALLAASALQHNLTLVTRNTSDFAETGVNLLNPWLERWA